MGGSGPLRHRVLHVLEDLDPGSVQRLVCEQAKHLDPERFETGVLSLRTPAGAHLDELRSAGVATWEAAPAFPPWPRGAQAVSGAARAWRPDLVHAHLAPARLASMPLLLRPRRPRFVTTEHGMLEPAACRGLAGRLDLEVLRRADQVIAVSEVARLGLVSLEPRLAENSRVIADGLDLSRFRSPDPEERMRARSVLGVMPDQFLVGAAARCEPGTGLDLLAKAFSLVAADLPDAVLVLSGDGEQRPALENLLSWLGLRRRVRLLPGLPDVRPLLYALDLFVVPSGAEGGPLKAIEAMACGCPTVASGTGGMVELAEAGALSAVPAGATNSLADAIRELGRSPAHRELLAHLGRTCALDYAIEKNLAQLERLYLELLGEGAAEPEDRPARAA